MASLLDRCVFTPTTGGLADFTVLGAVLGFMTPASAGAVNGALVPYAAQSADLTQWELGHGIYSTTGPTLARTTILFSSNANAKVNFTLPPTVLITALAEDLVVGPSSTTTGHLAVFADATGKLLSDGGAPGGGGGSVIGSRGTVAGFGALGALARSGSIAFGNIVAPLYIMSELGVAGDGGTDDTAALNAAFALASGNSQGGTYILDGTYNISDTINIGSNTGGNLTGPTSFISVICTGNAGGLPFHWTGPGDGRPAIRFCVNKYFRVEGLGIQNFSSGTNIGIQLGGDGGTTDSGTACLSSTFVGCSVGGFSTGIQDGNFGDSSEILWLTLSISACGLGWTATGFNTLDHTFVNLSMNSCTIGLDSGASEGYHVFGGSSSDMGICFKVQSSGICDVNSFRQENSTSFVTSIGGSMTLRNCNMKANGLNNFNDADPDSIVVDGTFDRLTMDNCSIQNGWVRVNGANYVSLTNNFLKVDPTSGLPFLYSGTNQGVHVVSKNNESNVSSVGNPLDFEGFVTFTSQTPFSHPFFLFESDYLKFPQNFLGANTGQTLGTDYLALSHVRHLAEGPVPNILTPPTVTAVTNAVTTGAKVLHFASVPASVQSGMIATDNTTFDTLVVSKTNTTVTIDSNQTVGSGVTITFSGVQGFPLPGQNLRVSGTFATSATLNFTFIRSIAVTSPGGQSDVVVSASLFAPTDVGKAIKIAGKGNNGWTDWFGYGFSFTDSAHLVVKPAAGQQRVNIGAGATAVIGQNEPDANYIVASIVGNAAAPESYSVTAQTSSGFTVKSSNASSTATITCLIVR